MKIEMSRPFTYTNQEKLGKDINTIISTQCGLNFYGLKRIFVHEFEFSFADIKRYTNLKYIVFENHYSEKFEIIPRILRQLGCIYISVQDKSKTFSDSLKGTGINGLQIYGQNLAGEKIPLIIEPEHSFRYRIEYEYFN